jgi:hypothetical protein
MQTHTRSNELLHELSIINVGLPLHVLKLRRMTGDEEVGVCGIRYQIIY